MIHEVKIKAVLNGYVVNVGCQAVVFTSLRDLLGSLESYLKDPKAVEAMYRDKSINKFLLYQLQPAEPQCREMTC